MRRAALLCLALLTTGPALAEPMKIVEPDDGRGSDQYWSPAQRVSPGRHVMDRRAPIGSANADDGSAGWAGPASRARPSGAAEDLAEVTNVEAPPLRAPLSSTNATALIHAEAAVDAKCRSTDGTRETEIACEQRAAYMMRLNEIGWCFGKQGDGGANMKWHRCTRTSFRYGD